MSICFETRCREVAWAKRGRRQLLRHVCELMHRRLLGTGVRERRQLTSRVLEPMRPHSVAM